MSDARGRVTSDPMILRTESGKLIVADDIASKLQNFVGTAEGTLQSIVGPAPLVPEDDQGAYPTVYGNMYGIYHTTTQAGTVDLTILHTGSGIYHYQGWDSATNPWKKIVGSSSAQVILDLQEPDTPQFPTQFETTPRGVVIVPQNGMRAIYYDGEVALPLGYDTVPPAPFGYGPETEDPAEPNAVGYSVSHAESATSTEHSMHRDFGFCRLGTIIDGSADEHNKSRLLRSSYQAAYQWINHFGDLSPLSGRSSEVVFVEQKTTAADKPGSQVQKQVLWGNINSGPTGTIGRVLSRTKDTQNSGTQRLFILPANVGYGTMGAFATIQDNTTQQWPDNTPDSWIVSEPHAVLPVPIFKLCRLAFGRLWIANTPDDPGILIPSRPGRYGTFAEGEEIFPDPSGGEITGLWSTSGGLLVFTISSTFLLQQSDDGKDFRLITLNAGIGCVAPSSIASLEDGSTIWLGREGFYLFADQQIQLISEDIRQDTQRINAARAKQAVAAVDPTTKEYRCWVPLDGARENSFCFTFSPSGWRRRTTETVQAVCVTKDHRKYMLAAGKARDSANALVNGAWVLDRQVGSFTPGTANHIIETSWITWSSSKERKSVRTVYLGFRESSNTSATIYVYRDWRQGSTATYTDSTSATLYTEEDPPPFWGIAELNSTETPNEWVRRRPYWKRVDVEVGSCEVYKIRVETADQIEFIGMVVDEEPKLGGFGSRIP